jgi:hypothetical protein
MDGPRRSRANKIARCETICVAHTKNKNPITTCCIVKGSNWNNAPLYAKWALVRNHLVRRGSGLLTAKYNAGVPSEARLGREGLGWLQRTVLGSEGERLARARGFIDYAGEIGIAPAPLAIAWCLRNPHVSSVILARADRSNCCRTCKRWSWWNVSARRIGSASRPPSAHSSVGLTRRAPLLHLKPRSDRPSSVMGAHGLPRTGLAPGRRREQRPAAGQP